MRDFDDAVEFARSNINLLQITGILATQAGRRDLLLRAGRCPLVPH